MLSMLFLRFSLQSAMRAAVARKAARAATRRAHDARETGILVNTCTLSAARKRQDRREQKRDGIHRANVEDSTLAGHRRQVFRNVRFAADELAGHAAVGKHICAGDARAAIG